MKISQIPKQPILCRWFSFLLGLGLMCALAFIVIPWIFLNLTPEMMNSTHVNGIVASALFYSETESAGEAFNHFSNSRFLADKVNPEIPCLLLKMKNE